MEYDRLPTIQFSRNGMPGICVGDAIDPHFTAMDEASIVPRLSVNNATKINIRINVSRVYIADSFYSYAYLVKVAWI